MNISPLTSLIAVYCLIAATGAFSQTENTPYYNPENGHQRYEAVIEEVIDISYHEFRSVHYRVTWKGNQIIIPDDQQWIDRQKGDTLSFLVMWHTMEGRDGPVKHLAFRAVPY